MNVRTLQLPRLVAGRDFADDMVKSFGVVLDEDVIVDSSRLLSGTPSFAAELVQQVLVDGKARSMLLVGAPTDFAGYAVAAAREFDVTDRLDIVETAGRYRQLTGPESVRQRFRTCSSTRGRSRRSSRPSWLARARPTHPAR